MNRLISAIALVLYACFCMMTSDAKRSSGITSPNSTLRNFSKTFDEATLRLDVSASGYGDDCRLTIDSVAVWPGWYGRRGNLDCVMYPEVMQVYVVDRATGDTIYTDAKSPEAFAEYGEEAPMHVSFLVPKPKKDCEIAVAVYRLSPGGREEMTSDRRHYDKQELKAMKKLAAERAKAGSRNPFCVIHKAADPKRCINLAMLAEGYTASEMDKFLDKAIELDSALFSQKGFRENAHLFNVTAVMLPSEESGITIPSQNKVFNSALGAHFDSFNTERLMTIPDTWKMWDALEGIPAGQVMILANTEKYGGSGAFNEYAIASAGNPDFIEIITHEFGHSFAWLGDEYEAEYVVTYTPDVEPLEPNITTLHDFKGKWLDLIDSGEAGLIEGAGYQKKGVWRGCEHCLMRSLADKHFCPVCGKAIAKTIRYQTQPQSVSEFRGRW